MNYPHSSMIVGEMGLIVDATHGCYPCQQLGAEPKPYSQLISNHNNLSKIGIVIDVHNEYDESRCPEEEFGPRAKTSYIIMRMLDGLVMKFMWDPSLNRYTHNDGNQIIWNVTPKRYGVHYNIWSKYGGAEEGGWWYDRGELLEYQAFNNEDTANEVAEKVRKVAEELSEDSKKQHGEAMLASMEWLDARGLDADYLPEPNGEEEYYVMVTDSLPQFDDETPHYE